jgi:hypothetical protein
MDGWTPYSQLETPEDRVTLEDVYLRVLQFSPSIVIPLSVDIFVVCCLLLADLLFGLLFDPEDGSCMSLRKSFFLRITQRYNPEDGTIYL